MVPEPIDILIPVLGPSNAQGAYEAIQRCLPVNNILVSQASSLATARQDLIAASATRISMFLDSDVIMERGDWIKASRILLSDGAGCVVLQPPLAVGPLQSFVSSYFWMRRFFQGSFFGTMATLFKTELLKGIQIPSSLSGAEDLFILLFLQSKGARIEVIAADGLHHHSPSPAKGRWVGSGLKRLQGVVGFRKVLPFVLRNVILYLPATAMVSLVKLDASIMRYGLALWREYVKGYLS